jgi:hypothetical protein
MFYRKRPSLAGLVAGLITGDWVKNPVPGMKVRARWTPHVYKECRVVEVDARCGLVVLSTRGRVENSQFKVHPWDVVPEVGH